MGWISRKVVTCVYGTRDQCGHWPVVWQPSCLAGTAFANRAAGSAVVIAREGISGRKGRSGAGFGGSADVAGGPGKAGIRSGIRTKGQQRKDRIAHEIDRAGDPGP